MNSFEDNTPDQFDYITTTDIDTEFTIEIADGASFSKLFDCLKNGNNAVIRLTDTSMSYIELMDTSQGQKNKTKFNIDILCEFNVNKFKTYKFTSKSKEYNLYIDVKTFVDKVSKIKDTSIKIIKRKGDETISIYTSASNADVSYLKPLVMQSCETFGRDTKTRNSPNCLINPKKITADSLKISPSKFKKVTVTGYNNRMIVDAQSLYQSDGHTFHYGEPINNIVFNINFDALPDISIPAKSNNKVQEPIMRLEIPTNLFKNIAKLAKLSDCNMKVFFERSDSGDCMKIITEVKNYATVHTYVMPHFDIN